MKFLVIGLGSMGKRRVTILKALNKEVIGFDISEEKRKEVKEKFGIKTYPTIDEAIQENPEAIIISTPPHLHYEYAHLAIDNNLPFFMEINLISEGLREVIQKGQEKGILMAQSCNMRNVESIKKIKELIDDNKIGNVTSFTYHVGQYLPDWHPNEDYRKFFGARKETNACKEIIPGEINWLQWIFGDITSVMSKKGKFSDLEIDAPDTYQIIMNFKEKLLGHYLVEVVSRFPYRIIKIIGTKGTITWDYGEKIVKVYNPEEKKWEEFSEDKKEGENYEHKLRPYQQEIEDFISAIEKEKEYPHLLSEDLKILVILDAIEQSTEIGKEIRI